MSVRILIALFLSIFYLDNAYAKCNFNSHKVPLYSEQITSEKTSYNLSIWPLRENRLLESDIDLSNKPVSIYKSILNSYQKNTLEDMLFYETEVMTDIKILHGHQRIIKAVFQQSDTFDLFLIQINSNLNNYFLKTIISTNIKSANISKVMNELTKISAQIKNVCDNKNE
ncbi:MULTISPECIES: hypothetical protein [Pseudoalteromonas]|uniref:hypothetical protein n=1 Tax=Pseudoalteromonas TaxID=53246 RepID=UPI00055BB4A3|nr:MULTISPECIES: hypothetical protein [Pseudoalteromonas]MAY58519.1 hypothetical protein [Pseudoalteromonas sp.]MDN3396462.1 hypothetical protein [Pseudoalteromonas sp. APC 3215]MDN3401437.1 hypothetical protein [Pseudoalteromonas sp. APC 3213]MDN3403928.1 hypothetical protein [Pseudoalteromonas sp. APC 3218]MDN3410095.1 hypothetical protein [Pseudoalteromonas sp. APC 3894]|tara:strand:+ start:1237 stop:1746 length:510 start_codon:yes stop_codon:yes gene_type:complete